MSNGEREKVALASSVGYHWSATGAERDKVALASPPGLLLELRGGGERQEEEDKRKNK